MSTSYVGRFIHDLRFQHPFCILVSGTTGAGKSQFLKNVIEKGGIKGRIRSIYYFMPRMETLDINPGNGRRLYCMEGIPTKKWIDETLKESTRDVLIVIDDQWDAAIESPDVKALCSYERRHSGVSMAFVTQNFYEQGKAVRAMKYRINRACKIFIFFFLETAWRATAYLQIMSTLQSTNLSPQEPAKEKTTRRQLSFSVKNECGPINMWWYAKIAHYQHRRLATPTCSQRSPS